MSKKKTGFLIAFGAVLGAAAAGISYYLKYKEFNDELDKDFHDYEEDGEDGKEKSSPLSDDETSGRTYISLNNVCCDPEAGAAESEDCGQEAEGKKSKEEEMEEETEEKTEEDDDDEIEVVFEEIPLDSLKAPISSEPKSQESEPVPTAAVTVEEDTEGSST